MGWEGSHEPWRTLRGGVRYTFATPYPQKSMQHNQKQKQLDTKISRNISINLRPNSVAIGFRCSLPSCELPPIAPGCSTAIAAQGPQRLWPCRRSWRRRVCCLPATRIDSGDPCWHRAFMLASAQCCRPLQRPAAALKKAKMPIDFR